jgi:hypothetical protein
MSVLFPEISHSGRLKRSLCICYVTNVYNERVWFLLFYSFGFKTIVSFFYPSLSRYFHYLYTTFYEKRFLSYVSNPTKRWQHDSITGRCRCRSLDLLDREIVLLCRHCCFPRSVPKYMMDDRLVFTLHYTSWALDDNIESRNFPLKYILIYLEAPDTWNLLIIMSRVAWVTWQITRGSGFCASFYLALPLVELHVFTLQIHNT